MEAKFVEASAARSHRWKGLNNWVGNDEAGEPSAPLLHRSASTTPAPGAAGRPARNLLGRIIIHCRICRSLLCLSPSLSTRYFAGTWGGEVTFQFTWWYPKPDLSISNRPHTGGGGLRSPRHFKYSGIVNFQRENLPRTEIREGPVGRVPLTVFISLIGSGDGCLQRTLPISILID